MAMTWDYTSSCSAGEESPSFAKHRALIPRLIAELGSEEYLVRRRAETQLIDHGADAFDDLQAAELSSDLEIATRAKYILYLIRVQWVRPNDSSEIRKLMTGYAELPAQSRRDRIARLAALDKDRGLGGLCRIARFDSSPKLARQAALAILGGVENLSAQTPDFSEIILQEIESAESVPVQWLRTLVEQLEQPVRVHQRWLPLIDAELKLIEQKGDDVELATVFIFMRYHLHLSQRVSDARAVFETLRRRVDLMDRTKDISANQFIQAIDFTSIEQFIYLIHKQGGTTQMALAFGAAWAIEHQQWEALQLLENHYRESFGSERLMLYLSAVAQGQQGREQEAEEIAARAAEIDVEKAELRNYYANLISELGRHDWAEREWRHVIDEVPATAIASLTARYSLASLRLHDRGEDREAADLLSETLDALEASADVKRRLLRDPRSRDTIASLQTQRSFYLACDAEAHGDFESQRKHLDQAARYTSEDPDVLIAKYHLKGADEDYRKVVRGQIVAVCRKLEFSLTKNPNDQMSLNHWAWLVSNTEGDFRKAVKFSLRSLQLSPGSPSYLDTLGRCYYSAGDLENAIRYQREAVKKHPHMQVMQRQLALFEKEFAQ
jgi:tetratricopeptide (TPR) repeat protein